MPLHGLVEMEEAGIVGKIAWHKCKLERFNFVLNSEKIINLKLSTLNKCDSSLNRPNAKNKKCVPVVIG